MYLKKALNTPQSFHVVIGCVLAFVLSEDRNKCYIALESPQACIRQLFGHHIGIFGIRRYHTTINGSLSVAMWCHLDNWAVTCMKYSSLRYILECKFFESSTLIPVRHDISSGTAIPREIVYIAFEDTYIYISRHEVEMEHATLIQLQWWKVCTKNSLKRGSRLLVRMYTYCLPAFHTRNGSA